MNRFKLGRKGLEELLAFVRSGDTIIVWKLDRLGRSLKDLIETFSKIEESIVSALLSRSTQTHLAAS